MADEGAPRAVVPDSRRDVDDYTSIVSLGRADRRDRIDRIGLFGHYRFVSSAPGITIFCRSAAIVEVVSTTAPAQTGIPRVSGAVVEVVSIIASIGVGQLVAGLVSPGSSPFLAVADSVVRLSPQALTEFGKSLDFPGIGLPKGVADKALLLVGIAVVLLVIGALGGQAAHRSRTLGRTVIIGLGAVGLVAVLFSPVFGPVDLLAPLAALAAGLTAFSCLYTKAERAALGPPSGPPLDHQRPAPDRPHPLAAVSRRNLMVSSAVVGLGGLGAGALGYLRGAAAAAAAASRTALAPRLQPTEPAAAAPAGADFAAVGTPTFITSNRDFYRIDTALRVPTHTAADFRLRVHGMVDKELRLTYDDLLARPLQQRTVTLACVSNPVNGDLISTANFVGVSLRELLLEAGVQPGADQLFSTSTDGWTCGTPTEVVLEPDRGAMLALGMNGEPLPFEHGYPVRMVVPGLYGYVSATKWLADLELTTFDRHQAYWLERGWAQKAPIKTQSRIDRPRGQDVVPPGGMTAAGLAWAQHRGISQVEVRLDGGPWRQAQLSTEVSSDTWRMWRADLDVGPGNHSLESRATDATGALQTDQPAEPIPDGATGWPMITFVVR